VHHGGSEEQFAHDMQERSHAKKGCLMALQAQSKKIIPLLVTRKVNCIKNLFDESMPITALDIVANPVP
jgi:hypothetical protein